MEFADLKNKTEKELKDLLGEKQVELRGLEFKASENQLKQTHSISAVKKVIARIQTLLSSARNAAANNSDTKSTKS